MHVCIVGPLLPPRSRAEGDLVVAVAVAGMRLGVVAGKQVCVGAARPAAVERHAGAAGESHGEVVAVDDGDVVEVLAAADGELGQRHGRLTGERAGERAAAVARLAAPAAAVEGAPRAAPDTAGAGAGGHVDGPCLPRVQLRAAAHWGRRRPHRRAAVVGDGECRRSRAGSQGGEEEQADDWGRCSPGRHGCCLWMFYVWRAS